MDLEILSDKKEGLKMMLEKHPFLVDVRTSVEFQSGSLKNAVNIPLDEVPSRLEEFRNKENIIVFCRSGHRSDRAKEFLLQQGMSRVLNGGNRIFLEEILAEQTP